MDLTKKRSEVSPELLIQHQVRNVHQAFSRLSNLSQGKQAMLSNAFAKVCTKFLSLINYSAMRMQFYHQKAQFLLKKRENYFGFFLLNKASTVSGAILVEDTEDFFPSTHMKIW